MRAFMRNALSGTKIGRHRRPSHRIRSACDDGRKILKAHSSPPPPRRSAADALIAFTIPRWARFIFAVWFTLAHSGGAMGISVKSARAARAFIYIMEEQQMHFVLTRVYNIQVYQQRVRLHTVEKHSAWILRKHAAITTKNLRFNFIN